jgi:hypothetical protein
MSSPWAKIFYETRPWPPRVLKMQVRGWALQDSSLLWLPPVGPKIQDLSRARSC